MKRRQKEWSNLGWIRFEIVGGNVIRKRPILIGNYSKRKAAIRKHVDIGEVLATHLIEASKRRGFISRILHPTDGDLLARKYPHLRMRRDTWKSIALRSGFEPDGSSLKLDRNFFEDDY